MELDYRFTEWWWVVVLPKNVVLRCRTWNVLGKPRNQNRKRSLVDSKNWAVNCCKTEWAINRQLLHEYRFLFVWWVAKVWTTSGTFVLSLVFEFFTPKRAQNYKKLHRNVLSAKLVVCLPNEHCRWTPDTKDWEFDNKMFDIWGIPKTSKSFLDRFSVSGVVASAFFWKLGFQKTFPILFIRIHQLFQKKSQVWKKMSAYRTTIPWYLVACEKMEL